MPFFVWKAGFCTGIEAVDAQHQALLQCLNDCYETLPAGKTAPIAAEQIATLYGYAATHFALEEALMRSINFPGLAAHAERHREFVHRVSELERHAGPEPMGDLLAFLRDWFLRHILEDDRGFVPYVKFTGLP